MPPRIALDEAWILRVTNTVPFSNRKNYEKHVLDSFGKVHTSGPLLPLETWKASSDPNVYFQHIGSYRVAFGNAFEYMHLFRFSNLSRLEIMDVGVCDVFETLYGHDLVTGSRYELLWEMVGDHSIPVKVKSRRIKSLEKAQARAAKKAGK